MAAAGPERLDFVYRIINADGIEVEQCGNGARCFVRFVHEQGLTDRDRIRVLTRGGIISPRLMPDGGVEVNMGEPSFDPGRLPFSTRGLVPRQQGQAMLWPLALEASPGEVCTREVALVSMGMVASGVGTWLQVNRFGPLGSGMLSIQSVNFSFVTVMIALGTSMKAEGLDAHAMISALLGVSFVGAFLVCFSGRSCSSASISPSRSRSEERRVGKECRSRWSPYH